MRSRRAANRHPKPPEILENRRAKKPEDHTSLALFQNLDGAPQAGIRQLELAAGTSCFAGLRNAGYAAGCPLSRNHDYNPTQNAQTLFATRTAVRRVRVYFCCVEGCSSLGTLTRPRSIRVVCSNVHVRSQSDVRRSSMG